MNRIMQLLLLCFLTIPCIGQTYDLTCDDVFTDFGGPNEDDGNGLYDTIVICPNTPNQLVSVNFTSFQDNFGNDEMFIFDGPTTNAPPIPPPNGYSAWGGLDQNFLTYIASPMEANPFIANNTSGCLTFTWTTFYSNSFISWTADISCIPTLMGCTDICDLNYDSNALVNDPNACSGQNVTFGDSCDDNNIHTFNDTYGEDCSCNGQTYCGPNTVNPFVLSLDLTGEGETIIDFNACSNNSVNTNQSIDLIPLNTYSGTYSPGICLTDWWEPVGEENYAIQIWIDYDNDLLFEEEEIIFTDNATSGQGSTPFSFTLPGGAFIGATGIRVRSQSADFGCPNYSCESSSRIIDFVANIDYYGTPVNLGCTNPCDSNFDETANAPDETACSGINNCGCIDELASNYNPNATIPTTCLFEGVCGGWFTDEGGPDGKAPCSASDTTVICPDTEDELVLVEFLSFETIGLFDRLYVYQGTADDLLPYSSEPYSSSLSDPVGSGPFTSTHPSGCLTFVFNTDHHYPSEGWIATVTCIEQIVGCTNPFDSNYNPAANAHDDDLCVGDYIGGCIDPIACNFDVHAVLDDGTCFYGAGAVACELPCIYYTFTMESTFNYDPSDWYGSSYTITNQSTGEIFATGTFEEADETYETFVLEGGIDYLCVFPSGCYEILIEGESLIGLDRTDWTLHNELGELVASGPAGYTQFSINEPASFGCTDPMACNYDAEATCDDRSCYYGSTECGEDPCNVYAFIFEAAYGSGWYSPFPNSDWIYEIIDESSEEVIFTGSMVGADEGDGTYFSVNYLCDLASGCYYVNMISGSNGDVYNWGFVDPDGVELVASSFDYVQNNEAYPINWENAIYGCTNPLACNYDPIATCDDGSCNLTNLEFSDCASPCEGLLFEMIEQSGSSSPHWQDEYYVITDLSTGEVFATGTFAEADTIINEDLAIDYYCTMPECMSITSSVNYSSYWTIRDIHGNLIAYEGPGEDTVIVSTTDNPPGCNDPSACNYNPMAGCNDGSCNYGAIGECEDPCTYMLVNVYSYNGAGSFYLLNSVTGDTIYTNNVYSEISNQICPLPNGCYEIHIDDVTDPYSWSAHIYQVNGENNPILDGSSGNDFPGYFTIGDGEGCLDAEACNYDPNACFADFCDYGFPECDDACQAFTFYMNDSYGNGWDGANYTITDVSTETVIYEGTLDYNLSSDFDNFCSFDWGIYQISVGGGDFDEEITWSFLDLDGDTLLSGAAPFDTIWTYGDLASCGDLSELILGCTDINACNYNENANCDNNACVYSENLGCTDPNACNYDENANCEDGSCIIPIDCSSFNPCTVGGIYAWNNEACGCEFIAPAEDGCFDPTACNFNPLADCENNDLCLYMEGCAEQVNYLAVKIILEGPYAGNGMMNAALGDLIPLTQPYNLAPYNYDGTETASTIPENVVDWILVEMRSGIPSATTHNTLTIETRAGFLLEDGSIVDTDGSSNLTFTNLVAGENYHLCIRHRNHLDILSSEPIIASDLMEYDFTNSQSQAYGIAQLKPLSDGFFAMYAGDYTQEGIIQTTDYDVWFAMPAVLGVYSVTDGTLDGVVQNTDFDKWFANKAKIGAVEVRFD